MNSSPLISIITPAYNHEKYIGECINSVLKQTFLNWEMLVINDGSTDRTAEIVQNFSNKDSRIKLFSQQNAGIDKLGETYNFALSQAKGNYIAILEGDDFWQCNEKLEIQINRMLQDENIVLCWGKAFSVIENSAAVFEIHPKHRDTNFKYYNNTPMGSIFNALFNDFPPPLTFLIRKDALKKIGGFIQVDPFPAVDLPTVLALSKIGKFYFEDKILGCWRLHSMQITKNNSEKIVRGSCEIITNYFNSLDSSMRQNIIYDKPFIENYYKRLRVIGFARSGRFKLIKKNFKGARADYMKAIFTSGFSEPVWKLRALVGLIMSFFEMDVEGLAKLFGKVSYK